ncbi:phage/plasmid primase, P4 family [Macrococcus armenti]|uniref:phage/plasmid primase, P4 family n=1 Tax=Macrococcus armenti TaxID=2875764 RepID=UPI001CCD849E|nr:phage/plasmid primase, P4 family [Macrococcus armenti]UBH07871.1 DUF5906 domain-containing protein [Macrococcus armenti]
MIKYNNFPEELTKIDNWCVWKYEKRNNQKPTKVPYNAHTGQRAKSNDSSTWSSFESALYVYNMGDADGIGFFFQEPYVGIDIDNVADDVHRFKAGDHNDNIVSEFHEAFKSYTEISPSGTGIHIIVKGKIPGDRRRKKNIEMYENGRFFTMTGNSLEKYNEVSNVSDKIFRVIYDKYLKSNVTKLPTKHNDFSFHELTESDVIDAILNSKQATLFSDLMSGNWHKYYSSQSEADIALCNILAFWCAKDFTQMDSLFRQSGLYREKWDEKRKDSTYGEQTLFKAINDTAEVFTPSNKEKPLAYALNFLNDTKEEKKELPARSWDDTGNADRFIDRYGDLYKYSYTKKNFYVYDGTRWREDTTGAIRTLIDEMVNDLKSEKLVFDPNEISEEDAGKEFSKFIKKSRNTTSKKNIVDELKHRRPIEQTDFDKDDMLINLLDGYINLASSEFNEHDIKKMFSLQASTDYSDKMEPVIWKQFLEDIFAGDKEVIRFIQKSLGYSLTGSIREQVMFILHGKGRNGKSIFTETVSEILGSYASNIQADSLMVKQNKGAANSDIARLTNVRFVTSSEPNEGFRFDEGLVKQLTGGDKITARFLYGSEFEFTPNFKIWISTNHKPIIRGTDDGIWRRMVLIPFNVQIPDHKVDKDLKYKLLREAPGILNWMVEGAYMWMKEGLQIPESIKQAGQEYRTEMDVLEHFIEDTCIRNDGYEESAKDLFEAYKNWAEDSGEYKMNKNQFGKKMKEKFNHKRKNTGVVYYGIELKKSYPGIQGII